MDAGQIVAITLKFIGAISLLLFGMKTMSEGIQNAAGRSLDKFFNYATRNRFLALFTGTLITVIIQSSSATTVMTVSFVNAGIMSFQQSIGIIFGANIGTTLTAWVVAIFGFKIKISAFALPLFGIGFLLTVMKKFRKENIGKALMGFGLLFLGFEFLKDAVPNASEEVRMYLSQFQGVENSAKTLIVGILSGAIITLLLNSSSVVIALIIVMASDGVLPWEFSAALVMGSNIGTTQDVFLASLGTKADAKRTAWVHILFSVFGSIIIACMFVPFLNFVEFMIPDNENNAAILPLRIAMFHTTFNVFSSAVFIGFTPQITRFMCWFIKAKPGDIKEKYEFVFPEQAIMETNADALMFHFPYIENEISKMMSRTHDMYKVLASSLEDRDNIETYSENLKNEEEYIDQMNKQIRRYMERCFDFMSNPSDRRKLFLMRGIVSKVEHISDKCYWMCHYINEKANEKVYFVDSENKDLKKFYGDNDEFFGTICNIMKSRASSVTNRNVFAELKGRAKEFESFSENRRQEARNNAMVRIMQDDSKENIMNIQEAEDMYIDLMSRIEEISNDIYKISKYISRL